MTGLGIIILLFACGATYYYVKIIIPKSSRKALNESAAAKAATLRAQRDSELSLENVRKGGVLSLTNIGPALDSFDAEILDRHLYKSGSGIWHELEGDNGIGKIYITLQDDEMTVTLRQPTPSELSIDEAAFSENPAQSLSYDGNLYHLEESGAATYCDKGNELEPEHFKYWDYETEDASLYLSLVQWQDGSFEANYSVPVKEHQVTVLSTS
jgi:hypothetical protein